MHLQWRAFSSKLNTSALQFMASNVMALWYDLQVSMNEAEVKLAFCFPPPPHNIIALLKFSKKTQKKNNRNNTILKTNDQLSPPPPPKKKQENDVPIQNMVETFLCLCAYKIKYTCFKYNHRKKVQLTKTLLEKQQQPFTL